jgi:NAD(P)-dependent dehydrogenase (short-subunit alcohol dehydrogenase family)
LDLHLADARAIVSGVDDAVGMAVAGALAAEGATVVRHREGAAPAPCDIAVAVLPPMAEFALSTLDDADVLLDGWRRVEDIVTLFRSVLPPMEAARHGRLILLGPIEIKTMTGREAAALDRTIGLGLLGMLKALSGEVGPNAVTCNAVLVDLAPLDASARDAMIASAAATVCYLASPHAAFLTGLVIGVDRARSGSIF